MVEKVGIIGIGNMGDALAAGLLKKHPEVKLGIFEKIPAKRSHAVSTYGASDFTHSLEEFFAFSDIAVVAIKPQDLSALLEQAEGFITPDTGIISIIAGKTTATIGTRARTQKLCRFMPNLAAREGKAFVGVSFAPEAPTEFKNDCLEIAEAIGTALEVPESLMPAVTGLSGSGIAYVFSFLHAMALGGTKAGIPYDNSLKIALSLLEGAAAVIRASGEHPVSLLSKVTSPAGTTIEGITALEDGNFTAALIHAVEAASLKAKEFET